MNHYRADSGKTYFLKCAPNSHLYGQKKNKLTKVKIKKKPKKNALLLIITCGCRTVPLILIYNSKKNSLVLLGTNLKEKNYWPKKKYKKKQKQRPSVAENYVLFRSNISTTTEPAIGYTFTQFYEKKCAKPSNKTTCKSLLKPIKKVLDFLDITLDLRTAIYKPYKKPNSNLR